MPMLPQEHMAFWFRAIIPIPIFQPSWNFPALCRWKQANLDRSDSTCALMEDGHFISGAPFRGNLGRPQTRGIIARLSFGVGVFVAWCITYLVETFGNPGMPIE